MESYATKAIRLNGSGYSDLTAYKAIKKIREEEKKMATFKVGDIVEYKGVGNSRTWLGLLLADNGKYFTAYSIYDKIPGDGSPYEVCTHLGVKWTDLGRLGYIYKDNLEKICFSLPEEDFNKLKTEAAGVLGLEVQVRRKNIVIAGEGPKAKAAKMASEEKEKTEQAQAVPSDSVRTYALAAKSRLEEMKNEQEMLQLTVRKLEGENNSVRQILANTRGRLAVYEGLWQDLISRMSISAILPQVVQDVPQEEKQEVPREEAK